MVIDEAGMAGTRDLAAVVRHVVDAGGSVRLVGDDQQLAAVAAGGVFADLAEQGHAHGTTATLTELHRFTDPAEGAATLAIRDGDPAALDHYLDHGRVHTGDLGTATEAAYAAWKADQQAGLSSLLLAATRDTVRELNQRARTRTASTPPASRLDVRWPWPTAPGPAPGTPSSPAATTAPCGPGTGPGSRTATGGTSWTSTPTGPSRSNATTTGHALVPPAGSRCLPGTSPSRCSWGMPARSTAPRAPPSTPPTPSSPGLRPARGCTWPSPAAGRPTTSTSATPPPSLDGVGPEVHEAPADPREVLTDILARDGRALSATTVERGDAARDLRQAVLAYQDALPVLAQQHLGPERMAALDDALDRWIPGLTQQPAYPHLRGQLALRWVDGTHPETVVEQATWYRGTQSLTEAEDPAAALAWRIAGTTPPSHRDAPLPWLPDIPPALRQDAGDERTTSTGSPTGSTTSSNGSPARPSMTGAAGPHALAASAAARTSTTS